MRERKRYIAFRIISNDNIEYEEFKTEFYKQLKELTGDKGLSEINARIIKNLYKEDSGIIKINHEKINEVKTTLSLMRKIENKKFIIKTGKVYGTLKKIKGES